MATTISKLNNGTYPIATLDTYNYTAVTTAMHQLSVKMTCANPMTGISVTIKQNGTTVASISEPPASSNEINCTCIVPVTAADALSFIITSSNAVDSNPNVIHGKIRIVLTNVTCGI